MTKFTGCELDYEMGVVECPNCQGENAKTGYVELWDGVCADCGRKVEAI